MWGLRLVVVVAHNAILPKRVLLLDNPCLCARLGDILEYFTLTRYIYPLVVDRQ